MFYLSRHEYDAKKTLTPAGEFTLESDKRRLDRDHGDQAVIQPLVIITKGINELGKAFWIMSRCFRQHP